MRGDLSARATCNSRVMEIPASFETEDRNREAATVKQIGLTRPFWIFDS